MALARLISAPLTFPGRNVEPFELVAWARPELTPDERTELLRESVLRLRPKGKVIGSKPIGITVLESAAWRLHGADAQALHDLLRTLKASDFEWVTFGEAAAAWPGRADGLWRLLANVEALDWQPPPYDDHWAQLASGVTIRQREERRQAGVKLAESIRLKGVSAFDDAPLTVDEFERIRHLKWPARVQKTDLRLGQHATLCAKICASPIENINRTHGAPALARRLLEIDGLSLLQEAREVFRCLVTAALRRPSPEQVAQWMGILERRHLSPEGAGRTLEEVGQEFKLTRERVRQICDRALLDGMSESVLLPVLERELSRARRAAPVRVFEVNEGLAELCGERIGIESLINLAEIMGMPPGIDIQEVRVRLGGEFVVVSMVQLAESMEAGWPKRAIAIARASIGTISCASIVQVAGMMVLTGEPPPDGGALEGALEAVPGFKWLDKAKTWFLFGDDGADSDMARRVRKMLSVVQHAPRTDEVLEALVTDDLWLYRDNKRLGFPPVHVVREALATWPWIRLLQSNRVEAIEPVGRDVLDNCEQIIAKVIEAHQGFALTHEIEKAVMTEGDVSRVRVHQALGTTPILRRNEYAMYTLVGRPINVAGLEAARKRQQARTGRADVNATESVIRITAGCLRNGQVTAPAWVEARFPDGRVPVVGTSAELRVGVASRMHGLRRIAPTAQDGDHIRIEWLPEGKVRVTLVRAADWQDGDAG